MLQRGEAGLQVRRADGAVLDPVAHVLSAGRLDRVAHRLDGRVTDGMGGHLEAGSRWRGHQLS